MLLVVYRIWASVRLRHLDSWLRSWLPLSVFSAGGGRGSVDAWYSTALDFEEVLCGLGESHVHVLLLMWLSPLTLLIVVFWISFLGGWVFLFGSVGFISVTTLLFESGSNSPVVLVHLGPGMGAFLRVARFA